MPTINDYETDPKLALVDAAVNPVFMKFMEPDDYELIVIDRGDGTQAQVQSLSGRSVRKVINRILKQAQEARIDLKKWICSPNEFNLCGKLDTTKTGKLMRELDEFLKKKWVDGGLKVTVVFAIVAAHPVAVFIEIFSAIGFLNSAFVDLCNCPKPA